MFKKLKKWARMIKQNLMTLYLVLKRVDIPWYKKLFVGLVVSYAFSPIDLIPDFIPILGYLDDAIIIPIGIILSIKMIPKDIFDACKKEAAEKYSQTRPKSIVAGIVIVLIWITLITYLAYLFKNVWLPLVK